MDFPPRLLFMMALGCQFFTLCILATSVRPDSLNENVATYYYNSPNRPIHSSQRYRVKASASETNSVKHKPHQYETMMQQRIHLNNNKGISHATGADSNSLNIKLPVPIGITPINIAPLPLQGGASYASLPRGVTSYGTMHPIR